MTNRGSSRVLASCIKAQQNHQAFFFLLLSFLSYEHVGKS